MAKSTDTLLAEANTLLKLANVGVSLLKVGGRIYLRGTFSSLFEYK